MKKVIMLRSNPVRPYPRLEKMANSISKMGYDVLVLAWDRDADYSPKTEKLVLRDAEIPIIRAGFKGEFSGGFKKNAIGLMRFEKFLLIWLAKHHKEYDIIHAYDFDCGYVASVIAKLYKKKLVYDIADYYVDSHGLKGTRVGALIERLECNVINKSHATIICTEERINQISKARPQNVVVIHNTPDLSGAQQVESESIIQSTSNKLKLVYVGILGKTRFIDKIAEIVGERDDCEFHIGGYGGGLESYFEDYANKYSNIFYYGRIPYRKTIKLEQECDVMCALYDPSVPNHKYAAPNKFYEALALGKPIIMAEGTGLSNVVRDYSIGEVVPYTEQAFNDAINRLIDRKNEFHNIHIASLKLYDSSYSWEEMERRINFLYQSILAKNR